MWISCPYCQIPWNQVTDLCEYANNVPGPLVGNALFIRWRDLSCGHKRFHHPVGFPAEREGLFGRVFGVAPFHADPRGRKGDVVSDCCRQPGCYSDPFGARRFHGPFGTLQDTSCPIGGRTGKNHPFHIGLCRSFLLLLVLSLVYHVVSKVVCLTFVSGKPPVK